MSPSKEQIHVTDHAVLRYLERAMDLNVELVRDHIATVCGGAAAFGAVAVRAEGLRFQLDGNRVCTVVPDTALPGRTQRAQAQNRIARA